MILCYIIISYLMASSLSSGRTADRRCERRQNSSCLYEKNKWTKTNKTTNKFKKEKEKQ